MESSQVSVPAVDPTKPRRPPGAGWPFDYEGDFNLAFFSGLFFGLAVGIQVDTFRYNEPTRADFVVLGIFALFVTVSALRVVEQYADIRFRRWILEHWHEIGEGNAWYEGRRVGPEARLVQYRVVLSYLVVHGQHLGRPVIAGTAAAEWARWNAILTTALCGWWFLLKGPFVTIAVLTQNVRDRPVERTLAEVANATLHARPLQAPSIDG